ncbi:MAG: glycosyltransferase family 4 protein [Opitutus sp.]|nr:glycosyltransferase family 4 protein [Opitutus sp.]MCS6248132.1 glycosyltransferase family 4 protein [Opitutus sp.]MCS6274730.1 glycosyltransferase family 4 protein [Opitutus sp.]MCS6277487.1 glycosyltransferase family 4 protein [Opitutus sp.]MCS6300605.1 glycosyltransferase family 4 protein [Opitutus sp.]
MLGAADHQADWKSALPPADAPVIAYLFTTFPKATETFLQREVTGLQALGVNLRLYSMWGGGGTFNGQHVTRFPKWKLLSLAVWLPWLGLRHPSVLGELLRGVCSHRPRSTLNLFENLLGLGFGLIHASQFRKNRPAHIHAVWGGAPAASAWLLSRLDGHEYSGAGHAYDLYQHGGDGWLRQKLAPALWIHTSTDMGRRTLLEKGLTDGKIHVIRRGLTTLPPLKSLRSERSSTPLRLLCVARLVPKKGLDHQLRIYAALKAAGVPFEARIAGEGPLRTALENQTRAAGLTAQVTFLGHRPQADIAAQLAWADVLLHTGVVAADGDRDGLPNVIPEAMSAGVLVVTSPAAATTEAITDGLTGRVCPFDEPARWVEALSALRHDGNNANARSAAQMQLAARAWVEANFDAHKNAARLAALYRELTAGH